MNQPRPRFAHRTAWRALIPAERVPEEFREPLVHLWLGLDAHLVHYPVKGGRLINIVGIVHEEFRKPGWSAAGDRAEILAPVRALVLGEQSARSASRCRSAG